MHLIGKVNWCLWIGKRKTKIIINNNCPWAIQLQTRWRTRQRLIFIHMNGIGNKINCGCQFFLFSNMHKCTISMLILCVWCEQKEEKNKIRTNAHSRLLSLLFWTPNVHIRLYSSNAMEMLLCFVFFFGLVKCIFQ